MDQHDFAYWDERATSEFQMAQSAASFASAKPHYQMAIHYLDKAEALKRRLRRNSG